MRLTLLINNTGVYVERGAGRKSLIKDTFDSVTLRKIASQFPPLPLKIPETTEEFIARGGTIESVQSRGELRREEIKSRRIAAATVTLEKLGIDMSELTI